MEYRFKVRGLGEHIHTGGHHRTERRSSPPLGLGQAKVQNILLALVNIASDEDELIQSLASSEGVNDRRVESSPGRVDNPHKSRPGIGRYNTLHNVLDLPANNLVVAATRVAGSVLSGIVTRRFHHLNSDNFLAFLADRKSDGADTGADIEQYSLLVEVREIAEILVHLVHLGAVYLQETRVRNFEQISANLLMVNLAVAQ